MKIRKIFCLLGFVLAVTLFFVSKGWAATTPEIKPPVITNFYGIDHGVYGTIWKIYLEAEAGDKDMSKIVIVVEQPARGRLPVDWIYLKPQYQKRLKGYIQWNTFSSKASYLQEWTQITLKVSIFDKAGNESNEVVFPFTFESGVKDQYQYELPAPFNEGEVPKLGNVFIDLYNPFSMDGDGGAQGN